MEITVSYSLIFKHQSSGLFWNAALFVGNSAYRHLSLSVVKMIAKEDTSGLSLSCCWHMCLFCSHVSSLYVEASLQRDGGSITAPHSVPSPGFNKWYWGNPVSGSHTLQAVILSCCESWRDHALDSAGMEDVWGAARWRCDWKWHRRKSIYPEVVSPSRLASYSKTRVVFWSSAWIRSLQHSDYVVKVGWALVL